MLEKKKMKKWKLLLVVAIALGLVTGCSKKDDEKNNESTPVEEERPEEDQKEEEKETTYRLGDVVPVGDVEYVVNQKIVTDVLGDEYINTQAQNMFLVVEISIRNNGDKALAITDSYFKLLSNGKEFNSDSGSAIYLGKESILFTEINPDASLTGKVIFDVSQSTIDAADLQLQVQTGIWGTEKEVINLNQ